MKSTHLLHTNVTAIVLLVAVLLLGGTAVGTGHVQFVNPLTSGDEAEMPSQQTVVVSEPLRIFHLSFADTMKKVFAVSREIGHPETLQAILLQETGGGKSASIGNKGSPVGKRSYGLMQVQVVAARSILERNPSVMERYFPGRTHKSLFDEEIIALLLTNDEANIRIAAHHFNLYLKLSDGDWERAVAAYNAGIGGVQRIPEPSEFPYVVDVKAKLEDVVRPFNRKHNLQLQQRL
jgi:Transglycosylase SLT domain